MSSLESKAKTGCQISHNQNLWVPLEEVQKFEKTCREFAVDLQETIDTAAEIINDYQNLLSEYNKQAVEYEVKTEAKIAEANKYITENMKCNCGECWAVDRQTLLDILP